MPSIDPIVCVCGQDMEPGEFDAWHAVRKTIVKVSIITCPTMGCDGNQKEQHARRIDKDLAEVRKEMGKR